MSKYCFYVFRPPPPPSPASFFRPRVYPTGYYFYSPLSSSDKKIKDGGYGVTNLNKEPSLAPQNTPALQPRF